MRKNTDPFAGFTVKFIVFTEVEPATSTQLLARPVLMLLVCTCKRQPV